MAKKVTLNDVAKELSKTNKSVGDLGKELSKTNKSVGDLGKELSKTNKSVGDLGKELSKTNKSVGDLGKELNKTIDDLGKELSKTVDDLRAMTKEGFDGVDKKLEQATAERKAMKRDVEEIKMKFAYTAWQIDVKELQERVVVLEKKNGIKC